MDASEPDPESAHDKLNTTAVNLRILAATKRQGVLDGILVEAECRKAAAESGVFFREFPLSAAALRHSASGFRCSFATFLKA